MSLSEVSHKLEAEEYGSPKDFTDDLLLIVKNSEVYNTDIRSLVSYCSEIIITGHSAGWSWTMHLC